MERYWWTKNGMKKLAKDETVSHNEWVKWEDVIKLQAEIERLSDLRQVASDALCDFSRAGNVVADFVGLRDLETFLLKQSEV